MLAYERRGGVLVACACVPERARVLAIEARPAQRLLLIITRQAETRGFPPSYVNANSGVFYLGTVPGKALQPSNSVRVPVQP